MAKARTEFEVVGDAEAAARLDKISIALANLNRQHLAGRITREQLTKATAGLGTAEALLESRLQTSQRQMATASQQLQRTTHDIHGARDAADLLAFQLGVPLPREMKKLISQSQLIGPALSTAFKFTAVTAAVAIIISLSDEIGKVTDKMFDWNGALKAVMESEAKLNPILADKVKRLKELRDEYDLIGLQGIPRFTKVQEQQNRTIEEAKKKLADLQKEWRELLALSKQTQTVQAGPEGTGFREEPTAAAVRALERMATLQPAIAQATAEVAQLGQVSRNTGKEISASLADEGVKAAEKFADAWRKTLLEVQELHGRNTALLGKLNEEAKKVIANPPEVEGVPKWLQEMSEQTDRAIEQTARLRNAQLEMAEKAQQAYERMAQGIESFFQRAVLTARSWKDVMNQIWTAILGRFLSMVSRMVAGWLLGQRTMAAATATGGAVGGGGGGGGGFLGALRSLFGFGGGGGGGSFGIIGPGGTAPFNPNARTGLQLAPGDFTNFGLGPALAGAGTGGVGLPTGTTGGATATGLAAGAGGLGGLAALIPAGLMLAGGKIGFGSPLKGAISGGLIGAGALAIAAAVAPSLLLSSVGFLFGPIGLALGPLLGLLFGFLGRGKKRKVRDQIERDAFRAIEQIESAYRLHKVDYLSAIGQLEQVRQQVNEAMKKVGWKSRMDPHIDSAIKRINELEGTRGLTGGLRAFNAVPEFAGGGRVHAPAAGGALPAILHDREVVLNPRQQMMVGPQQIDRALRATGAPHLDTGGRVGGGAGMYINIAPGAIVVNGASGDGERIGRDVADAMAAELNRKREAKGLSRLF